MGLVRPGTAARSSDTYMSFEKGIAELKKIVKDLESNNNNLEDSIDKFEQGQKILAYCKKKLAEAEEKVTAILGTTLPHPDQSPQSQLQTSDPSDLPDFSFLD